MTFINSELIGEFATCVAFPNANRMETLFPADSIKGTIVYQETKTTESTEFINH